LQKIIDGRRYRTKLDLVHESLIFPGHLATKSKRESKEKIIAKQPTATGMAPTSRKQFHCVEPCSAKAVAGLTGFRVSDSA
jgi:hypothetical protein